jgi:hypothetical protein
MKLAFKQQIFVLLCVSYCIFSINFVYSNSAIQEHHQEDHHDVKLININTPPPPYST